MRVGAVGLLGILFVALKLTNVIAWSWAWVLAPFWVPLALVVLTLMAIVVFAVAKEMLE